MPFIMFMNEKFAEFLPDLIFGPEIISLIYQNGRGLEKVGHVFLNKITSEKLKTFGGNDTTLFHTCSKTLFNPLATFL